MYFILSPPAPDAVVSRMLLTIELVTIAIAGLYGAFLFGRSKRSIVISSLVLSKGLFVSLLTQ